MLKPFSMECYPYYSVRYIHGRCDSDHTRIRNCSLELRMNGANKSINNSIKILVAPSSFFYILTPVILLSFITTYPHLTAAHRNCLGISQQSRQSTRHLFNFLYDFCHNIPNLLFGIECILVLLFHWMVLRIQFCYKGVSFSMPYRQLNDFCVSTYTYICLLFMLYMFDIDSNESSVGIVTYLPFNEFIRMFSIS